jgi:hypothetical protein
MPEASIRSDDNVSKVARIVGLLQFKRSYFLIIQRIDDEHCLMLTNFICDIGLPIVQPRQDSFCQSINVLYLSSFTTSLRRTNISTKVVIIAVVLGAAGMF